MPAETHMGNGEPLDPDEVFALVRTQLSEILEIDEGSIRLDSAFATDLDADSLAVIELVEALEDELGERTVGFTVDDDDLVELQTVRDTVEYVLARMGAPGGDA